MKAKREILVVWLFGLFVPAALPAAGSGGIEASYHGQLGRETGLGMLEKWCALPNFSFEQQGGIDGWTTQACNGCHIGASWNPSRPETDCAFCHPPAAGNKPAPPTPDRCLTCHSKDTAKRGDLFLPESDVHAAAGMVCHDCHLKTADEVSNHQFLKGTILDTTEPTMKGTLDCVSCHGNAPHQLGEEAQTLNQHVAKVACETCHTGLRPASALAGRKWNEFTEAGKPVTILRAAGWLPEHKWYDNTGPGEPGDFHLPILGHAERRDAAGARIYPFNPVTVDWFVKSATSSFDDVIIVPEVKAADLDGDRIVTVEEMRMFHEGATLKTAAMNFSISHSVLPAAEAFVCQDCHDSEGWVLDWDALGYPFFADGFESGDLSAWMM